MRSDATRCLGPVAGGAHELLPPAEPRQVLAARVLGREARVELPERARVVLHSLNHSRLGLLESRTYPNGHKTPLLCSLTPVLSGGYLLRLTPFATRRSWVSGVVCGHMKRQRVVADFPDGGGKICTE